jgi:hypothetical protein
MWLLGVAMIIALIPWGAERIFTFSQISYPFHCESQFGFKYLDADGTSAVASEGSMQLSYYQDGNGVGTYVGRLYYLDAQGKVLKELSIHRAFEFTWRLMQGILKSSTINSTRIQGDEISDSDAEKFVFPGFKVGHNSYGVIVKIAQGGYAAGSSHFPRAMCAPQDN